MKIQSLHRKGHKLAQASVQTTILEESLPMITKFGRKLNEHNLHPFKPTGLDIFQVNVGYLCNMTCEHCHVDAGPTRTEIMDKPTLQACLNAIKLSGAKTVDITGGAPEMNPHFKWFVQEIRAIDSNIEIIVRSNLTILVSNEAYRSYPLFFKEQQVTVIASLPCYTAENTDKQRGDKAFERSIEAIKVLNELGYGADDSNLNLHLVYNPGGAFLPGDQAKLELAYKQQLKDNFNLVFNNLYTITNLPISRFLDYLIEENKLDDYMQLLLDAFNPAAAMGVMCRNTLSVAWDGSLYDCDFNQMLKLPVDERAPQNIKEYNNDLLLDRNIVLGNHCYGCTAGAGSSCQGTVA